MRRFDSIVVTTSNDLNAGSFGIFEICASKWQESSTHINSSLGPPAKKYGKLVQKVIHCHSKLLTYVLPSRFDLWPPHLCIPLWLHSSGTHVPWNWKPGLEERWRGEKNVYGKIHDHIFIHTKVCIYMHLLYFVYCIYILCNMYLQYIWNIFWCYPLCFPKPLEVSGAWHGYPWNCLVTQWNQLNSKGFGFKAWNWLQTDTEHLGF